MAGLPPERDGLAPGARDRRGRHGSPPPLNTTARREPAAFPVALVGLLLAAAVARQALSGTAAGKVGATYCFALVLLLAWAGWQFRAQPAPLDLGLRWRPVLAGVGLAAVLLLPGFWLHAHGQPTRVELYGAGFFLPFVPSLLWVAPAEELFFRGLLQPMLRRSLGAAGAIVVVGVLFASIHLPAYGWSAMPLDLGVGLLIGWLREETRSTAACVTAHTLADLGSWFLA